MLQLVHEHGRLYTIEVNDNWREWDDDMAVGSVHLIETLEFFLDGPQDRLGAADPARPVPVPRGPRRGRPRQPRHDPRDRPRRSTGSTSTRSSEARPGAPGRACARPAHVMLELLLGGGRRRRGRRASDAQPSRAAGSSRVAGGRVAGRRRGGDGARHDLQGLRRAEDDGRRPRGLRARRVRREDLSRRSSPRSRRNAAAADRARARARARTSTRPASSTAIAQGTSPYSFAVDGEGVAGKAKSGLHAGQGQRRARRTPRSRCRSARRINGTALRDAVGFINFNQFVNQVDYADAATALNNQVKAKVLKGLDPDALEGKKVSVHRAPSPRSAPTVVTITPVKLEAGA